MKTCLQIKANLENVTDLRPNGDDFRWYLKFRCNNCGEESNKWIYISLEETFPIKGSKGEVNLVSKCKMCSRDCTVEILPQMISKYTCDDSESFKTLVGFDCRGLSVVDFSPRIGFSCKALNSNTEYNDIDLSDKEWVDYDEESKQSVGIYGLEFKFITIK